MTKLYISYYGDSISIVEGLYKKNKFNIYDIIHIKADDIELDYNDKYKLLKERSEEHTSELQSPQ